MPTDLSSSDSEVTENCSEIPETPFHENLPTCTRQTPCSKQSCLTCWFQVHSLQNPCAMQTCFVSLSHDGIHISNLTIALNTTTSKATIATLPAPPIGHWIYDLTHEVQKAILRDDLPELKTLHDNYAQLVRSDPNTLKFNFSDLLTSRTQAHKIINSSSPVSNSYSTSPTPTPSASFKPPRIDIPKRSGKSYDFYTWIMACSRRFEITQCPEWCQNSNNDQCHAFRKNSSVQQHHELDQFQEKVDIWIWKHPNPCCFQSPPCLRIHPRTCWRSISKDQELGIYHWLCARITSNRNPPQLSVNTWSQLQHHQKPPLGAPELPSTTNIPCSSTWILTTTSAFLL